MAAEETKDVAIKFNIGEAESAKIRAWIQTEALARKVRFAHHDSQEIQDQRKDARITLANVSVPMTLMATKTMEQRDISVFLQDFSAGGACIRLLKTEPLVKGGALELELVFIAAGFRIKGQIVGLRKE